jgi:cell wall-associated NlpC family hydrolase
MTDWRKALLGSMGYRATPQNMKFLSTWQRWEGGHTANTARFNWLNTTHGSGPKINSVGVRRFGSFQEGIRYTAETLHNGRYQDILDGLASGDPYSSDVSAGLQTWVSGRADGNPAYAAKVLGQPAAPSRAARAKPVAQRAKLKFKAAPPPPDGNWDRTLALIFDDDPEMLEIMRGLDDPTAQASGVVSKGGSIQPVGPQKGAGAKVAQLAGTQLGKPYVFGSGPGTDSFDCSDLIQWAYKQIGISIPRVTYDQINIGKSVKGKPYQPGDLIFPNTGHVVMYVGNGKVVAAPYTGTVVQYQPVPKNPLEVRRIL